MNLSFRRFSFSFLLIAIGLFPYMPLVHAEGEAPHPHHHDCVQAQQNEHEMDLCIQAVHDVFSGTQMDIPAISIVPVFIFPFWEYKPDFIDRKSITYFSHALDPPSGLGHHLVGIVQILV